MKFFKNNIRTILMMALVLMVAVTGDASAQGMTGSSMMTVARTKAVSVFKSVKTIIFVVGGFGLVGLAFQAIFGKIKWVWFGALAVGLAILAAAGSVVDYATGEGKTGTDLQDTFGNSVTYN